MLPYTPAPGKNVIRRGTLYDALDHDSLLSVNVDPALLPGSEPPLTSRGHRPSSVCRKEHEAFEARRIDEFRNDPFHHPVLSLRSIETAPGQILLPQRASLEISMAPHRSKRHFQPSGREEGLRG